ncbi:c(7)-type cytochrome triheme domain-containing protein [Desulfobulbus elongatus]|uniref:c(7)-type cytochrome triheme domain-containing protein n=1 Tax=Desulfobulbus elongatus TaxID=53332 RepID=UPI0006850304|nr:c(7)-type cytochrome triheme domain-containing protein [Desulfobulbus elongatus]
MKMKALLMATLCFVAVAGTSLATAEKDTAALPEPAGDAAPAKQYESFGDTQIVDMEPVKHMFSHKSHVVTAGLTCDSCHPSLFERKWGAAKAKGDYNMASLEAGKYCGACHDGSTAFNTTGPETCKLCHGSDMKQPEVIVFNRPVKGVVFSHKEHVDMGLDCASCHDSAFEMRKGAAEETPGKFTMRAFYAGKYCGVCHNGNIAFAANTRCTTCHIGVKGLEKMSSKAAADEKKH